MSIKELQIRDKACTICNGIHPSGRAVSKKLCDECGEDKKNWKHNIQKDDVKVN